MTKRQRQQTKERKRTIVIEFTKQELHPCRISNSLLEGPYDIALENTAANILVEDQLLPHLDMVTTRNEYTANQTAEISASRSL